MKKSTKKTHKKKVVHKKKELEEVLPVSKKDVKRVIELTKKQVVGVVLGIAFLIILFLIIFNQQSGDKGDVVAKVNDEVITQQELDKTFEQLAQQNPTITKEMVLNQTIMRYLILSEAKAKDIVVADEEVNSYIKNLESSFKQDLAPVLEQLGVTLEELQEQVKEQLMITQLLIVEASVEDVSITDEDLKKFYREAKDSLMVGERVEASHILVETEDEAKAIVAKLKAGADFAELAAERSIDPSAKTNKGNLGFFERGQMVKEFEDVAFALDLRVVSEPVKSEFGYHVIKVYKKESPKQLAFDEVKDNIKQVLLEQRQQEVLASQQEVLASYIEKLREKAQIKIF